MGEASRRQLFAIVSLESDALDRLGDADAKFFRRHPQRRHRLRLAGQAEVETLERVHGAEAVRLDEGERMFVVIKRADTELHLKAFLPNRAEADTDVSEDLIAFLYDRLASRGPELALLEDIARQVGEGLV